MSIRSGSKLWKAWPRAFWRRSQPQRTLAMDNKPHQPSPAKYSWREISRGEPPKRSASERITDFDEIYSLFDEATIKEQASRCLQCPHPSCVQGCPLSNRIPEWLALAA